MRGLTVVEIACLVVVVLVAAAAVVVLMPHDGPHDHRGAECMHNVRDLVGLLEYALPTKIYPDLAGVNLILWLTIRGELGDEDSLNILFCPVDTKESLAKAGGPKAYVGLDLTRRGHDALTSYAGRDLRRSGCSARPRSDRNVVLICDDSEDHHESGFVVGLTGGSVKFRHKVYDWELQAKTPVVVGRKSVVAELRCLRKD